MTTFNMLSKAIQKKIWDMGWKSFTPIQDMAIPAILNTNNDIILSSGTASGKTEAAFLPILSIIEQEAEKNLKVLYISPLKALINNQFERIISLCEYMNISINRWHGDVSYSNKKKFIKKPSGILQITPESIESLFINRTEFLRHIFQHLDFIVIDEIHSFLNDARGTHLQSLISRIEYYTINKPRIIGLSATINNFSFVKEWVNPNNKENVLILESPGNDKPLKYNLMHFPTDEKNENPLELFEDMRFLTREFKSLIFCNSRSTVEEVTLILNRLAAKEGLDITYFPHHSSIDKKEREFVEKTMTESIQPKSVVATSSLELGIDVGSIDIVIQLDSTFTVSSLKQRLGRSGRKRDSSHILQLYSTKKDSFLQSLAVMELIIEQWVEPAKGYSKPYDILFHQIISICKETNGVTIDRLLHLLTNNNAFKVLENEKIIELINHMIELDFLEEIGGSHELIVGIEGERILRNKDFYSVFMTHEMYDVIHGIRKIGKIDKIDYLSEHDNFILAGKLWKIKIIDKKQNKVYVEKAYDGKPPKYSGGGEMIHKRIPEKIMEILCSDFTFPYLNEAATSLLNDLRRPFHFYQVKETERIIWKVKDEIIFETFTGATIARTLVLMFRSRGHNIKNPDALGKIELPVNINILKELNEIKNIRWDINELVKLTNESEFLYSKYSKYLPKNLQIEMYISNEIDIEGTMNYLNMYKFRVIES